MGRRQVTDYGTYRTAAPPEATRPDCNNTIQYPNHTEINILCLGFLSPALSSLLSLTLSSRHLRLFWCNFLSFDSNCPHLHCAHRMVNS